METPKLLEAKDFGILPCSSAVTGMPCAWSVSAGFRAVDLARCQREHRCRDDGRLYPNAEHVHFNLGCRAGLTVLHGMASTFASYLPITPTGGRR